MSGVLTVTWNKGEATIYQWISEKWQKTTYANGVDIQKGVTLEEGTYKVVVEMEGMKPVERIIRITALTPEYTFTNEIYNAATDSFTTSTGLKKCYFEGDRVTLTITNPYDLSSIKITNSAGKSVLDSELTEDLLKTMNIFTHEFNPTLAVGQSY
ncbi:MAG: hypothetical protein K2H53_01175, partial [Clostridia bacterium]|nr:hypothetical protein [Clostridia bacterium]